MKYKLTNFILCISVLLSNTCLASELSYNFFQLGYTHINLDENSGSEDGQGFFVDGSFRANNNLYVTVGYSSSSIGSGANELDTDLFSIGVGYHTSIIKGVDLALDVSYLDAGVDGSGSTQSDDTGSEVSILCRYAANPTLELSGYVSNRDLYGETENFFGIGPLIKFGAKRSLGIEYSRGDDIRQISIFVRMNI